MKTVIFGGAGFIGGHYRDYFSSRNVEVASFDLNPDESTKYLDVRNEIKLTGDFDSNDIVFDLAAIHRMPGHEDHEYFETNIKGAENICAFAEEKGINNIIFTSSIAPYGAGEELKTEETLPKPNTPYGISKLVAEHIHRTWQAKEPNKRKLLIIRPGVVFGKGENGNNTRLYNALKARRFFYPGRKDTLKANIYVKDLVRLSLDIFNSYEAGVRLYNFTYEPAYSIEEIVNTMCDVTRIAKPTIVVNGNLLKTAARLINMVGINKEGIHPTRIDKLMKSTNISGEKIIKDGFRFYYDLKTAIEDWYKDCDQKGLL